MPSQARIELDRRLDDFDEIIDARDAICPTGAGRPAQRRGTAVVRAGVVMISAAFEAYIEDVYDCAVDYIYQSATDSDRRSLKSDTSEKLNNASVFKINRLFFNIGIPWIMKHQYIRWQKFSNSKVQETLGKMISARNSIAHGGKTTVRKNTAVKWKKFTQKLADRIDLIVAERIEAEIGNKPW